MKKKRPEKELIRSIIEDAYFKTPRCQRLLACYPIAHTSEKNQIIIDLMDQLWNLSDANALPFNVFRDFDAELTRMGKKGHFTHQFEVFLFGWVLIKKIIKKDRLRIFKSICDNDLTKLFFAWLITATAHDFGYPIQAIEEIVDGYEKGYKAIYTTDIANRFKKFTSGYSLEDEKDLLFVQFFDVKNRVEGIIDIEKYLNYGIVHSLDIDKKKAKDLQRYLLEKRNHGYISALILCRTYIAYMSKMGFWNSEPESWRIEILRMASTAIALHALPLEKKDIIKKFSFNLNPLTPLLYLIDNLHEWNRSFINHAKYPLFSLSFCNIQDDALKLEYQLFFNNWTPEIEKNTKNYIAFQNKRIAFLKTDEFNIGLKITVKFYNPFGSEFDPIIISL